MANQVPWTKIILETFLEESGLNDRVSMGDGKAKYMNISNTLYELFMNEHTEIGKRFKEN